MSVTAAASTVTPAATTAAKSIAGSSALGSLGSNFNNFLSLLMTQLQNQDPTAPMDTNQFTSQLVQFTSVEQQINTNTSLTQLIQATQGSNLMQSSALIGQTVQVSGSQVSLQSGKASLEFTGTTGQPVDIGIYSAAGAKLRDATVQSTAGSNTWTWDGKDNNGATLPDGAYKTVVQSAGTAVPFTALGTVTSVQRSGTSMSVALGGMTTDLTNVQSVGAK